MTSQAVEGPAIRLGMSLSRASLAALDVGEAGVPGVWGTSQAVRAMLTLAHYRGIVTSAAEVSVLEDISADLQVQMLTLVVLLWPPGAKLLKTTPLGV